MRDRTHRPGLDIFASAAVDNASTPSWLIVGVVTSSVVDVGVSVW